ncbi:unnamed protein product [Adineta ricciae]|uniref:Envelope fusion glycoprotein n=1 Tax=Adineta ricciae TaxID=249248 RepID=A0A815VPK3_ADIRI|nr:unnamed protein product [Adineta ricciae]CAF1580325.1 unnamed protein product [Adineta ricciae]
MLLFTSLLATPIYSLVNFTIPKSDVVHTKSGLIFHYLSQYRPANRIVTFTVTIPMLEDMCYLIPKVAMKKIPYCFPNSTMAKTISQADSLKQLMKKYGKKSTVVKRPKRFLGEVISIGVGSAALALSTVNTIQLSNLKGEVKAMSDSLMRMDQTLQNHQAQILHLSEGQLKLAQELNHTQVALNKTMDLVMEHAAILRSHDTALRTITSMTVFLSNKLAAFVHSVDTHFIHSSIDDILSNKLNLGFVHHKDLPRVVELVTQMVDVSFDEAETVLPVVELVTRLLVQQNVDFVPAELVEKTENGFLIGKLTFTSFFAAPSRDQVPYSIYELVPIPFNQGNNRVRLAQMPQYLGIQPNSRKFIRWSMEEATSCDFVLMTSCRETPAIRRDLQDTCLYEILTDSILSNCRTEPFADPVFVHRVGQHWAISVNSTTQCHSTNTFTDVEQHQLMDNNAITLPPVALITTMDTSSLLCDKFFLPGVPVRIRSTVNLIQNLSINPLNEELFNLHELLSNNTSWAKLPYFPPNMQAVIDFISNTPKPVFSNNFQTWSSHPISLVTIVIIVVFIILIGILLCLYYVRAKKNKTQNVTLKMPSMKVLEQLVDG